MWMDEHEELIELRLSAHAYLLTIRCFRRFVDFLQDSDKEYKVNIVTTTDTMSAHMVHQEIPQKLRHF